MQKKYHVTLSFAGEDRQHAEELANLLKSGGYSVFYDKYEPAELWGKDLYAHFSSVYKDQAEYCVMFLSQYYAQKLWTNHERKNAQARAFEENREYILPVRLDDTEVPGIPKTIGFLDARLMTIEQIYEILVKKLSDPTSQSILTNISPLPPARAITTNLCCCVRQTEPHVLFRIKMQTGVQRKSPSNFFLSRAKKIPCSAHCEIILVTVLLILRKYLLSRYRKMLHGYVRMRSSRSHPALMLFGKSF